ncbi:hypothetical protein RD792_006294 [Penstemon davidsonii]|uniref:Uncharacterized protein n=1 Tax=Penstemon davidsonii TaxID=160366 RepID=A0ABR0DCK1_9LAMI|nr:hypothetical protein RD792_006294 [Penstemon davidsonii]
MKECRELSILPIIGIGGLGKTTLAQLVFNDDRVVGHFDIKLWVCVSDDFDYKTLIKAILESASGNGSASDLVQLDTLQRRLWELLNQKKYLLVLDDVWNQNLDKWTMLKSFLASGSSGASIIVTTRLKSVADIMSTFPAHHLVGLSEEDCWSLLKHRAFGQEEKEHPNLEAIGKDMVKKCVGVPLAAKALGGLLRFKRKEKEWIHIKESEIWNLPQTETSILPALRLSYNHLPLKCRQCFAYCAVIPKDSEIKKQELIFMWVSHGYISSNGAREVEDVGDEIWSELVLRCFFENVRTTMFEGEIMFKMHDLIHDLAQSIMENKVLGTQVQINIRSASNAKIRQVNLRKHSVAFPTSIHPNMDLTSALMNYSRLRILNASKTNTYVLPSSVGRLKHLRYLNLSFTKVRTLPNAICSMWNLKILNLEGCRELVALPKNMRYMHNLRHIFLSWCDSLSQTPPNIGELKSLKTLSDFIVGEEKSNQLKELEFLNLGGMLFIGHLERVKNNVDAKKANLGKKQNICTLGLEWEEDKASKSEESMDEKVFEALQPHPNLENLYICGFKGSNFPLWMRNSTLENLVRISISNCPSCLCLPQVLGELPRLKFLRLKELAVEYIIECESPGINSLAPKFPRLEHLELKSFPNLKGLLEEEVGDFFPVLRNLGIEGCSSLKLPKLPSLSELRLDSCNSVTLSSSAAKLDNLKCLWLEIDENMACVPKKILENLTNLNELCISQLHEDSLPEEGLRILKSLKELTIRNSKTLTNFPKRWVPHLTSLERLFIFSCPEFVELQEEIKYLQTLKSLCLQNLPKMISLPKSIQLLPSLQSLELFKLLGLTLLPDWFGNLTSLNHLTIYECPNIASLPATIQKMKNLKSLYINKCPELGRRCEKGKGEDWHKIAHIPVVQVSLDGWW